MTKTCTKCNQEKLVNEFSKVKQKSDGLSSHCRECCKLKFNKWLPKNKNHIKEYHKKYVIENKQKIREYRIKTKQHRALYMREWREKNKYHIGNYKKEYHKNVNSKNINYKIIHALRNRLRQALKTNVKCDNTKKLVGCSIEFLKNYLEKQFNNSMTWDNYGRKGWHIDHIKPCASFDLSQVDDQRKCFHYTNLQPLWWLDNCIKNKY